MSVQQRWAVDGYALVSSQVGGDTGADVEPPTVVLVHGVGVSSRYFVRLARELGRDAVVVAPDLVGFGHSPRAAEPLTVVEHAEVLAGLLDQLVATHRRTVAAPPGGRGTPSAAEAAQAFAPLLVGHSMGAQVVAELAIRRPDLCRGVVLLGPVVDPAAPSPTAQGGRLLRDTFHEPLSGVLTQVREWLRTGVRWYLRTARRMCEYRLEERLPLVEVPVLLVRGAKDPVTPASYLERLAGVAGARTAEVAGGAHLVMWSRPAEVAALCRAELAP